MNSQLAIVVVVCMCLMAAETFCKEVGKEDKKNTKRGLVGLGYGAPPSPYSTASTYAAANALAGYGVPSAWAPNPAAWAPNPWALEDPATAWAGQGLAGPWLSRSYKSAAQAANEVAAALSAAKEATAAAVLAQQRVAGAKENLLAQQRIAAAKESAAAAAIQRSEAAAAAAAAIQRSEAAAAAAAAIQRSAASAAHASAAQAAAVAAAATPVPSHASHAHSYLAAKKAAEYAAWG